MPIPRYRLDDRSFDDLVQELVSRIPGHTPEWTNPQPGDPGRTIIDLFAWLADTILYRINLIPERQRLEFLRLLQIPMRPATPAQGIIGLKTTSDKITQPIQVPLHTVITGPANFETTEELNVFALQARVYVKRIPTPEELERVKSILDSLESVYNFDNATPYVTTQVFGTMPMDPNGFDFIRSSIDNSIWIALCTLSDKIDGATILDTFKADEKGSKLLNIGIYPRLTVPQFGEIISKTLAMKSLWEWEMPSKRTRANGEPAYIPLDIARDTTEGFSRSGIIRLVLPEPTQIGLPENSVDEDTFAGTGDRPPRIDDPSIAERLISWIRLRPKVRNETQAFTWIGVNAVSIDQRKTFENIIVATSTGAPDQEIKLPSKSIEIESFALQVEESSGFVQWYNVPLHTAGRDDRIFELDGEAGTVTFGDGVRGMIPEKGRRIRVLRLRAGGGKQGNIPAGNLSTVSYPNITAEQPVATSGGIDGETLEQAEKRIPAVLRHSSRAITAEDYKDLALDTPGLDLGRVEVLPKFKPQQRLFEVIGVMSVMVIPKIAGYHPPYPRPDRNTLARVHSWLDERRPIGVELYTIGPEYIPIWTSVAVTVREGAARDQTLRKIIQKIKEHFWPLFPGGHNSTGWELGRTVNNQELEVVVARVQGILTVNGVNLFAKNRINSLAEKVDSYDGQQNIRLEPWQLPELQAVIVVEGDQAPQNLDDSLARGRTQPDEQIPIPIIPEMCR